MFAGRVGRDDGFYATLCQPIAEAAGIIGSIGQEPSRRSNGWQQIACGRQIVAIAGCDQESNRAASILGQRVDFCGAPATRAADRLFEVPPFAPAAERWALMCVESIDIVPIRPVEPVNA